MVIKKQKAKQHKSSKLYIPILFLTATFIFSIAILVKVPSHFSLVAAILLLTSIFAIRLANNPLRLEGAYRGIVFGFIYSFTYLLIILYWSYAGPSACSEFFGSYRSCLGSAQQIFLEIIATPIILLTATQPVLKKRS